MSDPLSPGVPGPEAIPTDAEKLNAPPAVRGIVDAHTHLFPDALFARIRRWFHQVEWHIPYPYRTDEVIGLLRRWGVEENWALVYAHKPGVADGLNAWLGQVQREHPGVRGFATVHPADPDPVRDLRRALDDYGLVGMKLHAEVQRLAVDDERLDGAFALLEERQLPCVLHAGDAPYPVAPPNLTAGRVANRMARQPRLVAVIAHLGMNQTERFLDLMARYPSLCLEASFTRFPGFPGAPRFDPEILAPVADRVLFGSDFPNITFSYADQVAAWAEVAWVRANPDAFFRGNARRLLPPGGAARPSAG